MKKSELKSGMLIVNRKGARSVILLNTPRNGDVYASDWGMDSDNDDGITRNWGELSFFNDDLTHISGDKNLDIVEVWSYPFNCNALSLTFKDRRSLWKREEDKIVKLNDLYKAVIHKTEKIVKVGCQDIPFTAIEKLYNEINKK